MNAKILHWSYRDFREFPNEMLDEIDNLEEIYLKENFIPSLPLWLFEIINLKFIQLSGNVLTELPTQISQLKNLEHLDVSKNNLKELPITLIHLNKLQYLNVSENEIYSINKGLCIFFSATDLELEQVVQFTIYDPLFTKNICWNCFIIQMHTNNSFSVSFADFGQMKSLETLILSKNQFARIPVELSNCATITELFLSDNNIIEIPTKIMSMPNIKVIEAERK